MKTTQANDHKRVSPEGRAIGFQLCRLTEPAIKALEREGEPDERCKTCAFRYGTVPNGCLQTMGDAVKAVIEGTPFLCHAHVGASGQPDRLCHGWFAARWATRGKADARCPWEFSPPDEPTSVSENAQPPVQPDQKEEK